MDKITQGLLAEFAEQFDLTSIEESERFETFATFLTTRKHYSEAPFDPPDLVVGKGGDTGIDGIAIIVNNSLISDVDSIEDLVELNGYLETTFIFVQAERSEGFDGGKIGTFGAGVQDFFGKGKLERNDDIKRAVEIMEAIYKRSGKFSKGNPLCYMYYVTTGKWQADKNLVARASAEVEELKATGLFKDVEFVPIGADQIQKLYNQTKNSITREFDFPQRTVVPEIAGVKEAYLGLLPATTFLSLVRDDEGDIIKSLFYENVRDWEGYNAINAEIRETLKSEARGRFPLMNNGVTIIAKTLFATGNKFTMGDFQIVNGCQTSHVLHDNWDLLTDEVRIPVRIISTKDEAVTESVITATNRQTEVKPDQFFALKDFAKRLEEYFKRFDADHRLYYERRTHQYDSEEILKSRIVGHQTLVRAVGAMFLNEPHRTTRNYKLLAEKVGKDIFRDGDRMEPYYVAAYAAYRLTRLFSAKKISSKFVPGRYHILLAARLIMDGEAQSLMNSADMGRRCEKIMKKLWDDADEILNQAIAVVDKVAEGNWDRDHIRTQPITDKILAHFGLRAGG
ncbi:AIPR family protein [Parvibaculum sp.]|uniref:AIPR family protein n=1 Tax=Parvibaculum sp. TaxID=2024848 RepID=UPI001DFE3481|nr:AIPR family protein [Parvibaculum sp.]MBX3490944.1 AIPR family protein [Parvibaculum sp.]MCW5728770.1 AIPR family protein [Parvibaculum sp.]